MKILILAAHPDDAEFAIGGTIASHTAAGDEVTVVNFTNGEPTPYGSVETRLKEADEAGRILGLSDRVIMDLPNRYLEDTIENRKKVAAHIRSYRPDLLLVQQHLDQHPDHTAASYLGTAARFYAKLTKSDIPGEPFYPPKILYYYTPHFRLDISPSFVIPVEEEHFETKMKAAQAYRSQFKTSKNQKLPSRIEQRAFYYGSLINNAYGEPFYTPEVVGVNNLKQIV